MQQLVPELTTIPQQCDVPGCGSFLLALRNQHMLFVLWWSITQSLAVFIKLLVEDLWWPLVERQNAIPQHCVTSIQYYWGANYLCEPVVCSWVSNITMLVCWLTWDNLGLETVGKAIPQHGVTSIKGLALVATHGYFSSRYWSARPERSLEHKPIGRLALTGWRVEGHPTAACDQDDVSSSVRFLLTLVRWTWTWCLFQNEENIHTGWFMVTPDWRVVRTTP